MKYITLDGEFTGTGVWDQYACEYLDPVMLSLSPELKAGIISWAAKYRKNTLEGMPEAKTSTFQSLDEEGLELSNAILNETNEYKIDYYYSDFLCQRLYIAR